MSQEMLIERAQDGMHWMLRDTLVRAVEKAAAFARLDEDDRDAVYYYAKHTERVAIGEWTIELGDGKACRCPISGAGIDRMQSKSNDFAQRFDEIFGVATNGGGTAVAVLDAPPLERTR